MINPIKLAVMLALLTFSSTAYAALYPTAVLKNNFGEQSTNYILGGSNQIDVNFVVDSTNGNGLGVRSVKTSPASISPISAVYMHTSASPASGNPNPAPGYIVVQFAADYAAYIGGYSGFVNVGDTTTAANVTSPLTLGNPYLVYSVGSTTQSQWAAIGLPAGVVPAAGASFIAAGATVATGSGQVMSPLASGAGVLQIEVVGDANKAVGATAGAQILMQVLGATSSSVTTLAPTAPVNGTVIGLRFVYR